MAAEPAREALRLETLPEPVGDTRARWIRGAYMVLFAVLCKLAGLLAMLVALLQFGFTLVSGEPSRPLLDFSRGLSRYIYDAVRFLTYGTEDKPFPFKDWPSPSGPQTPS